MPSRDSLTIKVSLRQAYVDITRDTERYIQHKCSRARFYRDASELDDATAAEYEAAGAFYLWRALAGELLEASDEQRLRDLIPPAAFLSDHQQRGAA